MKNVCHRKEEIQAMEGCFVAEVMKSWELLREEFGQHRCELELKVMCNEATGGLDAVSKFRRGVSMKTSIKCRKLRDTGEVPDICSCHFVNFQVFLPIAMIPSIDFSFTLRTLLSFLERSVVSVHFSDPCHNKNSTS